jgi:hypothetical protein
VTVPAGVTLTIGRGQIIKAYRFANLGFVVSGTLSADGSADQPIILTSSQDDVGGDTNNDGAATTGGPSQWNGILFAAESATNVINHVEVRYAGEGMAGAVVTNTSSLSLTNSRIIGSNQAGLRIASA